MILSCNHISKSYGVETILNDCSFFINDNEKAAIVGNNGAGKSTIMKIIMGELSPDDGNVIIGKDKTIGYLAQYQDLGSNTTIYEEVKSVKQNLIDMEQKLLEYEKEMAKVSGDELSKLIETYTNLEHRFQLLNGYSYKSEIEGVIKGLGFTENDFNKSVGNLSGGQKTRVALCKLLLEKPDIIMLDEPTNHLDLNSIKWLETYLLNYNGAVLIIAHDRYFLDKIVSKVIEIENHKAHVYSGNYSDFAVKKQELRVATMNAYLKQQSEIKHQEEVIAKLRSYKQEKFYKRAESREKQLEKMDLIEKPEELKNNMTIKLEPDIVSGNDVLSVENLEKSYNTLLFKNISFEIKRGEHVAIIGDNGTGKTTILKIINGLVDADSGMIKLGTNVHIGYYDQEQAKLDESKTIFEEIADTYPTLTQGQIRNMLAAFVFTGDDVFKPISALSGGEKGRVSLAKIMLSKANLLMLDEPTNHLDMFSKEVLESALNRYEGTVIYISHDRYFINKTAEKILELTPDGVILYNGNYDYYLEKKAERARNEAEKAAQHPEKSVAAAQPVSDTKNDWLKQKEQQAAERRLANRIAKLEKTIEETEAAIAQADEDMAACGTDYGKANEIYAEKTKLEERLEALFAEWEELNS